jgi:hypothetical protein
MVGYGFDEASGNFQSRNYTGAPGGNDYVLAEAQDGSGGNNANFNTPADNGNASGSSRPRMQMFEWRSTQPNPITISSGALAGQTFSGPMAGFGASLATTGPISGQVVAVNDGSTVGVSTPTGTLDDGCQPFTVPAGSIALVQRGACNFTLKIINAQNSNAAAVIVGNNIPGPPTGMSGTGAEFRAAKIPSVMVGQSDYALLKPAAPFAATITDGTGGAVNRDSDLDAAVITHEYGHGISNRLTGGRLTVSCLNNDEQMGEGWSDFYGMALTASASDTRTTARGVGTYVSFQPSTGAGIRPTAYSTDMAVNPATYASVADTVNISLPHGIGYVWNTMLNEVYWNLVDRYGFNPNVYAPWNTGGNNLAIQLVTDGLKFQPCRPGFVTGRDAILQADQARTGGANACAIWRGFAKRGLGTGASQGSSLSRSDGVQSFALPAACEAKIAVAPGSLTSAQESGKRVTKSLAVDNTAVIDANPLTWTVTEAATDCAAPSDLPWVSASPASGVTWGGSSSGIDVTFDSTGIDPATSRTGRLCIASNDPTQPVVSVPVSLNALYTVSAFLGNVAAAPALNGRQAGSTEQISFSLNGSRGSAIFAAGSPFSQAVDCVTAVASGPTAAAETPGATGLKYNAELDRYTLLWKTDKAWEGTCRRLVVRLADGTDHSALFDFRK